MRNLFYVTLALLFLLPTISDSRLHAPAEAQDKEQQEAPGTFRPSEKVPADSAISFPVDI